MSIRLQWFRMLLLTLPVALIIGCSTDQTKESAEGAADGSSVASGADGTGIGSGSNLGGTRLGADRVYNPEDRMGGSFDDPSNPLSKRIIYFDYDHSDVRPEYQAIIASHAAFLAKTPKSSMILEGHTDERGSREYNLALGERRAQAVRQIMQLNGAAPSQLEVVSYGEERPAAAGHDESGWQLSRRVELVYRRQ
ncbi:Peptidoglycan-associated lipoprotein [Gammaproteobacteria bacterium]